MHNASDVFYSSPVTDLSQGDIVEISPHAFIDPPLRSVVQAESGEVSLNEVVPSRLAKTEIVATCQPASALIINYDCEIAKERTLRLALCPVVPLTTFRECDQGNVKRNRTAHLFFLPRFQEKLVDSVVVLNQVTTIHRVLLSDLRRIATLTASGRLAFYGQFVRWLTRWELRNIACPNCGWEFDPTLALPIRSAGDK